MNVFSTRTPFVSFPNEDFRLYHQDRVKAVKSNSCLRSRVLWPWLNGELSRLNGSSSSENTSISFPFLGQQVERRLNKLNFNFAFHDDSIHSMDRYRAKTKYSYHASILIHIRLLQMLPCSNKVMSEYYALFLITILFKKAKRHTFAHIKPFVRLIAGSFG